MMTFTPKVWLDEPITTTPISAAALIDLETRLSGYTDTHTELVHVVTASGAAQTIPDPVTTGNATVSQITLTANCTITLPPPTSGKSLSVATIQDATGGRVITWATPSGALQWPGGASPTYTSTAAARDITTFMCIDGANWIGLPAGYDIR